MNNNPVWVVQSNLGSVNDFNEIESACKELSLDFIPVKVLPFSTDLPEVSNKRPTIFYGSSNFVTNVYRSNRWKPGSFFNEENFCSSKTISQYGDYCLNADAIFTTMDEFSKLGLSEEDRFFIRPNGDLKEFAGNVYSYKEFCNWCEKLRPGGFSIEMTTKIVVAKLKNIENEWRLFVVNNQVISGSRYRSLGRRSISKDVPNYAKEFGEKMARIWSPEIVFVLDIAQVDDSLKVIEINGFNSSGFYESNIKLIIQKVSEAISNSNSC